METVQNSKLTQEIEHAESTLKAEVEKYNQTVTQLQQLQQLAHQQRDVVLQAQERFNTFKDIAAILAGETIKK